MARGKGGLGRGLDSLFEDAAPVFESEHAAVETLPLREIEPDPDQPRKTFEQETLSELAASIAEHGLLQPIAVRPRPMGGYSIVAGERRWRASRMAGLTEVPVVIKDVSDEQAMELALVENLQREDLDPVEEAAGIREKILWPLTDDRLRPPLFNGFIWRFLFDAAILRDNAITFEGAYLEDELFLMEYFANVHRLAVTDKPLYRYLENPASATHRYMRDYPAVFARFLERKAEIVEKYGLDAARPQWRANTVWAGLLIAVGNEYVKSNPKPVREKRKAVEALCAQPEFAKAIRELHPKGLGRNKQIVADLIGSGRFGTLTALYRLKNRM